MGDPVRTAGCSLSVYDPRHLSGRIVIDVALCTKRTSRDVRSLVAIGVKADMAVTSADFRVCGPDADICWPWKLSGHAITIKPKALSSFSKSPSGDFRPDC
jgi:hypothetical protein